MFLQSSPLLSSVVRMEFGREVFHDGLEPLDASRLAQGEKGRCATSAFHTVPLTSVGIASSSAGVIDPIGYGATYGTAPGSTADKVCCKTRPRAASNRSSDWLSKLPGIDRNLMLL